MKLQVVEKMLINSPKIFECTYFKGNIKFNKFGDKLLIDWGNDLKIREKIEQIIPTILKKKVLVEFPLLQVHNIL